MLSLEQAKECVEPFFTMKEDMIFNLFAQDSEVVEFGTGDYRSLLVPGSRKDKALLVAHVDTVFQDSPKIKVEYNKGLFRSANRGRGLNKKDAPSQYGFGIGADDRAGVAILWQLRNLGHSILLTGCEELGCLGSMQIMSDPLSAALIQQHQFAVQFDRRDRNDIVFYHVGSDEFEEYVQKETGYKTKDGSYTDICVLCEEICGVNMSVGYKNEHGPCEVLNLRWWNKTLEVAYNWLSKDNLPRFVH